MPHIDVARKAALDSGEVATKNLAECLAIDQAMLMRSVLPSLGLGAALADLMAVHSVVSSKGISHQVSAIGKAISQILQRSKKEEAARVATLLRTHPSDTVRAWGAFASARALSDVPLCDRLHAVRPFAADAHFGVREWAWLAVRPYIAADINCAVSLLREWVASPDPNIRRFAVESTRPRGVWSEHIAQLKSEPSLGLPLLEPLKADPARYVQDSVANWLNDASKTSPAWVLALCERWSMAAEPATERIVDRALRTLRKDPQ